MVLSWPLPSPVSVSVYSQLCGQMYHGCWGHAGALNRGYSCGAIISRSDLMRYILPGHKLHFSVINSCCSLTPH